jgi:hypothetical protein
MQDVFQATRPEKLGNNFLYSGAKKLVQVRRRTDDNLTIKGHGDDASTILDREIQEGS